MEIKNFFQKIFSSNKDIQVPAAVVNKFKSLFSHSLNVEWQKNGDQYEAVFYEDELEHIASFSSDGSVVCQKINLRLSELPATIKKSAQKEGELMNAISIECEGISKYELIVRDKALQRFFLLMNTKGEIVKKEKL